MINSAEAEPSFGSIAGLGSIGVSLLAATTVFAQLQSAAVLAGLFGLLFRYLPDAHLPWSHAVKGGVVTALLFSVGKALIGMYLVKGQIGCACAERGLRSNSGPGPGGCGVAGRMAWRLH